jgi:hypothetical protein
MSEPPVARGVACSRAAPFTATAALQQGARSSAAAPASSPLVQQVCEGAESQQSAARTGRAVDPARTLTAMTAASRRIAGILLGFRLCGNRNSLLPPVGRFAALVAARRAPVGSGTPRHASAPSLRAQRITERKGS